MEQRRRWLVDETHTDGGSLPNRRRSYTNGAAPEVGQSLTIGSASRPTHVVRGGGGPTDSRRSKTQKD